MITLSAQTIPERFSREMGISHVEFFRTLPAAVQPYKLTTGPKSAIAEQQARQLVITLHEESKRTIASLSLPTTRVDFAFRGFTEEQRRQFMRRFDLCYQRGGG